MDSSTINVLVKGLVDTFDYIANDNVMVAAGIYCRLRLLSKDFKESTNYWLPPIRAKNKLVLAVSQDNMHDCEDYYVLPNGERNGEYTRIHVTGILTREFYLFGKLLFHSRPSNTNISALHGCDSKYTIYFNNNPCGVSITTHYGRIQYRHDKQIFIIVYMLEKDAIDIWENETPNGYKLSIYEPNLTIMVEYKRSYIYAMMTDEEVIKNLRMMSKTRNIRRAKSLMEEIAKGYNWNFDVERDMSFLMHEWCDCGGCDKCAEELI